MYSHWIWNKKETFLHPCIRKKKNGRLSITMRKKSINWKRISEKNWNKKLKKRKLPNDKTNMNLLTRLFALHFDRSFSGKGWRQLAWLFGVIVTVFLLIYLWNLIYNYLTICKWVVYEFCFWNKKQIRNKNGFLGKSSFFCLHYFSFLSLACNQSTNPSYYYAFSSWFNICFFIYPGIRSEKRKVLFSMIGINMCKVKNNHPSNQIFVYF